MYTSTSFETGGSAENLIRYIQRGTDIDQANEEERDENDLDPGYDRTGIYDAAGMEVSEKGISRFVTESERDGARRSIVFSTAPINDDISNDEMHRNTRQVMNRYLDESPSASYVYGIHHGTDRTHAHVAVRGDKRDLWQHDNELNELKVDAEKKWRSQEHAWALAYDLRVNPQEVGIDPTGHNEQENDTGQEENHWQAGRDVEWWDEPAPEQHRRSRDIFS